MARLSRRLLIFIIAGSSFLTLFSTLTQLSFDFQADTNRIRRLLDQIESSYVNGIENSLWSYDDTQLNLLLNGILTLPDIVSVRVVNDSGQVVNRGMPLSPRQSNKIQRVYQLTHRLDSKKYNIGTLTVTASMAGAYRRLRNRVLIILATNLLKTFPLSFFILFVLNTLVIKRLEGMAFFTRNLSLDNLEQPLKLERTRLSSASPDELDEVTIAINEMRQSLLAGISEIRKIEKERLDLLAHTRELVNVRDDFILLAAHELRTPLTSIRLQIELIKINWTKGQPINQNALDLFESQVNRLSQLIETLFTASRWSRKEIEVSLKKINLSKTIEDILKRLKILIRTSGYDVILSIMPDVIVSADVVQIEEVLTNLISNAIKFGRKLPIKVGLTVEGKNAVITVDDRGIGISKEHITRIFGKFERGVSLTSYGGLGLGLYIAAQIIEAHGGKIKVQSTLNQGSCFTIELPLTFT